VSTKKLAFLRVDVARSVHPIHIQLCWEGVFVLLRIVTIIAVVVLLASAAHQASAQIMQIGADEIAAGKEASVEIDKEQALVEDEELNTRIRQIGEALASVANSVEVDASYGSSTITEFDYQFKIVEGEDVNAFCLPGGIIYMYKGLIDQCETDHELAGVLAHEIAHAAHHHMVHLIKEQSRLDGKMALILVAGLLGNIDTGDMSNVMMGTQFYRTGKMSGYGQKAEYDADKTAIEYMIRAGYNPVGMLTFLERLAKHPDLVDWGILQTHPRTGERVDAVKVDLLSRGVEINRRLVTTSFLAQVKQADCHGISSSEVIIGREIICNLGQIDRANLVANQINALLDTGLQFREIKVCDSSVTARGDVIVEFSEEDAQLAGKSQAELAAEAADALRRVLFNQMVAEL